MSIIAHLAENDFIIGGDAMYVVGQLDGSQSPPPRPADAHNLRRSLPELRLFRSQFPGAVITPEARPGLLRPGRKALSLDRGKSAGPKSRA
jgi:hypothetical protein